MGGKSNFMERVRALARAEGKYHVEAYLFVFQALEFTLKRIGERRHVKGAELLEGIRDFAVMNFGAMGKTVFEEWGVKDSKDFGRIVFALVETELMSKTEGDRIEDFEGGFDFERTFWADYVPADLSEGEETGEESA